MSADTDTLNVVSANTYWNLGVYQLGLAILSSDLKQAAINVMQTDTDTDVQGAVAFLQGTSLEVLITTFGLGLSAFRLRDSFSVWYELNSQSSA